MHRAGQEAHCNAYNGTCYMSISKPKKVRTIIHDKMDHAETTLLCFASKTKTTAAFMWLPVAVTSMIAHGHGDVKFAHFFLDVFPSDSNQIVGLVAKLLCDLEKPPMSLLELGCIN
jgi:hypothetical protein